MTRVTLTLPTWMDNYQECLEYAQGELCVIYGGVTCYDARGKWVDGDGNVESEPVTVVESYADESESLATVRMDEIAEHVHGVNRYDETAIAYTVNNEMYTVTE